MIVQRRVPFPVGDLRLCACVCSVSVIQNPTTYERVRSLFTKLPSPPYRGGKPAPLRPPLLIVSENTERYYISTISSVNLCAGNVCLALNESSLTGSNVKDFRLNCCVVEISNPFHFPGTQTQTHTHTRTEAELCYSFWLAVHLIRVRALSIARV